MLFSEPIFLFFFLPLLLVTHALSPHGIRNGVLALASILFYAWDEPAHVWILLGSVAFNYAIGFGVAPTNRPTVRCWSLRVGIVGNLSLLGFFKYFNFAAANLNALLSTDGSPPLAITTIPLPLGISFFTFQCISYIADVHRGHNPRQENPVDMTLYIALFPQLIAGPIVRYREIADQIRNRRCGSAKFRMGAARFVIGLGKKVLVADILARPADLCFQLGSSDLTAPLAWLGLLCYTLQIYFDFSGYSDMAIGLGQMFGFKLPENFRYPYVARCVTDFWQRWHLTLSHWFRDYLYIPLGGNRRSPLRTYLNLFTVFLLCGLWHGASWSFVLWGFVHGSFLIVERIFKDRVNLPNCLALPLTLFAVMMGWVLFRCETLPQATAYFVALFGCGMAVQTSISFPAVLTNEILLVLAFGAIAASPVRSHLRNWISSRIRSTPDRASRCRTIIRVHWIQDVALCLLFGLILLQIAAQTYVPFLYFRF